MKKVSLLEVGPRDGLQSEPTILSTDVKRDFIIKTMDAGIKQIEVTSFVHPKKVPQMADAEKFAAQREGENNMRWAGN